MTKRYLLAGILLAALASPALALDIPEQSERDHRVRYVSYDETDVVQLDTVLGTATHIVLEPGETLLTHAFGDSMAYEFAHKSHHLFIKPVADKADTNLLIVTDRRNYSFRLTFHDTPKARAVYRLQFRYPDTQVRLQAEQDKAQQALAQRTRPAIVANWQSYTRSGVADIAPVHVWDDGKFTWMQFSPYSDLPAIYMVDADGQEVIVNQHIPADRTVVLHRLAAKWHLRLGNRVVAIHNEAYGNPAAWHAMSKTRQATASMESLPAADPLLAASAPLGSIGAPESPSMGSDGVLHIDLRKDNAMATYLPEQESPPVATTVTQDIKAPSMQASNEGKPLQEETAAPAATSATSATASADKVIAADQTSSPGVESGAFRFDAAHALAPSQVVEQKASSGQSHTRFTFRDANSIPGINLVDNNGQDQLLGLHIEPPATIVMHGTGEQWRLHRGNQSLVVQKEAR